MALVTLDEVRNAIGSTESDSVVMDRVAAVSSLIERYCNRAFPKIVSSVAAISGDRISLTIPRHGMVAGTTVKIDSSTGEALDGEFVIESVSEHLITIESEADEDSLEGVRLSVRKRYEKTLATNGGDCLFIDPRPVVEIDSLELTDGAGGWAAVETTNYALANLEDGESVSGELVLITGNYPARRDGRTIPQGARVRFYAGSPWVQADIAKAAMSVIKNIEKQHRKAGLSSERYDYYSYQRFGASQLKELFGEVEHILASYRLTAI